MDGVGHEECKVESGDLGVECEEYRVDGVECEESRVQNGNWMEWRVKSGEKNNVESGAG